MKKILMLEDNRDRISAFQDVLTELNDCELLVWRSAHESIEHFPEHLASASLISLDHDLVQDEGEPDPGDGLEVAEFLGKQSPVCPVIMHTTNINRVYSMIRELEDGGWETLRVAPSGMGEDWIQSIWLPKVKELLSNNE